MSHDADPTGREPAEGYAGAGSPWASAPNSDEEAPPEQGGGPGRARPVPPARGSASVGTASVGSASVQPPAQRPAPADERGDWPPPSDRPGPFPPAGPPPVYGPSGSHPISASASVPSRPSGSAQVPTGSAQVPSGSAQVPPTSPPPPPPAPPGQAQVPPVAGTFPGFAPPSQPSPAQQDYPPPPAYSQPPEYGQPPQPYGQPPAFGQQAPPYGQTASFPGPGQSDPTMSADYPPEPGQYGAGAGTPSGPPAGTYGSPGTYGTPSGPPAVYGQPAPAYGSPSGGYPAQTYGGPEQPAYGAAPDQQYQPGQQYDPGQGFPEPGARPPDQADPAKRRKLLLVFGIVAVVALLAAIGTGVTLAFKGSNASFNVGDCVKQSGSKAVEASCSEGDAFKVVSKVDDHTKCPDSDQQPYVVIEKKGTKPQVLCLRPASQK
jgi:hypothetical protein